MPTLAGTLVDAFGPRAPFAVQTVLSLAGAALLALFDVPSDAKTD